ncbi:hypothetical protein FMM54_02645, partial [Campylobacter sp. LR185c]|uniref:hypothetical protein n=1 Tax=Campylobacter sp. LR185c TaxID=2014525 RepID=UPI001237A7AD
MNYLIYFKYDGLGARLVNLSYYFYLANRLGNKNFVKFAWLNTEGFKKAHLSTDFKGKDGVKTIGFCVMEKEEIFSPTFIKKYYIDKLPKRDFDINTFKNFDELQEKFLSVDNANFITIGPPRFVNEDDMTDRLRIENAFNKDIEFSDNVKAIIKEAKNKALEFNDYNVINLRAGDVVYFGNCRKKDEIIFRATYFELALQIIKANPNKKFIIFSEDVESVDKLCDFVNSKNVISANKIRDWKRPNLELFFFDIAFMSCAKELYSSATSSVPQLARYMNKNIKGINTLRYFSEEQRYEFLKKNIDILNLHPMQKALSYFHLFILARNLKENYDILIYYLRQALKNDLDNDKYRIHIIANLVLKQEYKKANRYLSFIFNTRYNEFISLFFEFQINTLTNDFLNAKINSKFPYLCFLNAKIANHKKLHEKAINFAKMAYDNGDLQIIKELYLSLSIEYALHLKQELNVLKTRLVK